MIGQPQRVMNMDRIDICFGVILVGWFSQTSQKSVCLLAQESPVLMETDFRDVPHLGPIFVDDGTDLRDFDMGLYLGK